MHNRLAKLREKRAQGDGGFTLIELLVVVVIIGILIAIAIPLYLNYKQGANDKSAQSDLRGAISALEQCNTDNTGYPNATFTLTASGSPGGGCTTQTISLSTNTTLVYYPSGATAPTSYIATAKNSGGTGKIYCYSSAAGGGVTTTTTALTAYRAAC